MEPVTSFRVVLTELAGPTAVTNAQGLAIRKEERNVANSPGGNVEFSVTEDASYGVEILAPGYALDRFRIGPVTRETKRIYKRLLRPRK